MSRPFKTGFVCGRFQMVHNMHKRIIDTVVSTCDKTLVMLGSAQIHGQERNPFTWEFRAWMMKRIYGNRDDIIYFPLPDMTHENDINHDWGRYVLANAYNALGAKPELMAYGNDENRHGWFDEKDIEHMAEIIVPRVDDGVSGTNMRKLLLDKNFWDWRLNVPIQLHTSFNIIRDEYIRELGL